MHLTRFIISSFQIKATKPTHRHSMSGMMLLLPDLSCSQFIRAVNLSFYYCSHQKNAMTKHRLLLSFFTCLLAIAAYSGTPKFTFTVVPDTTTQRFQITMTIENNDKDSLLVKMPAWTPGYYQLLNFADNVYDVSASSNGKDFPAKRVGRNGWKFGTRKAKTIIIKYAVEAKRAYVATPFLDETHGYIAPTGIFMHVAGAINNPVTVELKLPQGWTSACGLERLDKQLHLFKAPDFDILYDSPILLGPLEELPSFEVRGITHHFVGYKLGDFDKAGLINDLKKVVEAGVAVIGEIPYKHYTFLAIGPGAGGIEHLNSTTFGFSPEALKSDAGRKRFLTFLAHEYFHHYNVKRIRPVELGPFDYDKENRTNMLWVSEGITVYYDLLITRRAGILTDRDLLDGYHKRLLGFENKPGRLYQSATQASYNTWSDGPFGRQDDEINKTVSVYDKGAILGLMLDFNIRHVTANKKSLDDVMRRLYQEFYLANKRGFTENEFQSVCEEVAGTKLSELFEYVSTVKVPDYKKYFNFGGLDIDTMPKEVSGAWLGLSARMKNDSLVVSNVEYESPAWNAGVRRNMKILAVDDKAPETLQPMISDRNVGDVVKLKVFSKKNVSDYSVTLAKKIEPSFTINPLENPDPLQRAILETWLMGNR